MVKKRDAVLKQRQIDMTEGGIVKPLLLFFFPLMAGTFFQMLYNAVDTIVVGRFVGTTALSAVGGTAAQLINIFVGIFVGIASGSSVLVSQAYGAGNGRELEETVHTSAALALIGGVILTLLCTLLAPQMLGFLKTPAESMADATKYLRIFGMGMLPNMVYNMGAGILRAIGDSRRPFLYLVISTLTNIVLDFLLVAVIPMGVAGAALATVLAQLLSAVLAVSALMRTEGECRLSIRKIRMQKRTVVSILRIGIPAAIQSMMYSFSNTFVQTYINGFGTATVAAWSVEGKIDSIFWMIINSLGISLTTFTGQNYGAGRMDRVYKAMRTVLVLCTGFTVAYGFFLYFSAPYLVPFFSKDPAVIEMGVYIARYFGKIYFTFVCVEVFTAIHRGMGDTFVPTLIMVIGVCAIRFIWLLTIFPLRPELDTVSLCYPVTWVITSVAMVIYFTIQYRRRRKRGLA